MTRKTLVYLHGLGALVVEIAFLLSQRATRPAGIAPVSDWNTLSGDIEFGRKPR
jgi:hypothetical protein